MLKRDSYDMLMGLHKAFPELGLLQILSLCVAQFCLKAYEELPSDADKKAFIENCTDVARLACVQLKEAEVDTEKQVEASDDLPRS